MADDDDATPWLRDMVDEDLLDLFSEDLGVSQDAVRRLIAQTPDDPELELRLIDLLDAALEHENDDSSASLCATIVLGEVRSRRAVDTLIRSLSLDFDEALQEAAGVAILRIGAPAIESLMEAIQESEERALAAPGYMLLGKIGVLEDEALRRKVLDFLEAQTATEDRKSRTKSALTELFFATAYLGDRSKLDSMREWLAGKPQGSEPGIQDAAEVLEENEAGVPIVGDLSPWEESYGWLFGDAREEARVNRAPRAREQGFPGGLAGGDDEDDGDEDLSVFYRGLHAHPSEDPGAPSDDEDSEKE